MKTCKKLLAVTIALVLLVSTFVSGLVVSAAEPYSVTIADTEITAGEDATVNVTVDFKGDALDALHMLATVDTTLAIADAAIVSVDYADDYKDPGDSELEVPALRIKNDGKNLEAGKILFESGVDGAVKAKKVVFALTFEDVAEGTYPIAINVEFTNYAEGEFPALTDEAEIVVKPAHVCEGTVLSDNGNGTHDVKCKCGEVVTAGVACEYVDGFCACGAAEPVHEHEWVWTYNSENFNYDGVCACEATTTKELEISDEATSIKLSGKALMLEDAVTVVYYLVEADVAAYDGFYALVERTSPTGVIPEKINGVSSTVFPGECEFLYKGVAAKMLNDNLDVTVYAVKDGVAYPNATISYNVISYAESKLKNAQTKATLKTVIVDLLNFGAEAQKHFKYNASNLANAWLSEEYLALGTATDFIPELTDYRNYGDNNDTMPVKNTSPALELESSVLINYFMDPSKYVAAGGSLDALTLVVETDGKIAAEIPFAEFIPFGETEYRVAFKGLKSFQMRDLCYFTVYENYGTDSEVAVSDTMTYSVESYAARRKTTADIYNAAMAMMRYGDSAYEHFIKNK